MRENYLLKIPKFFLFILAFTPLIIDKSVFFPFITGKSLLVRVMITLTAVFFIAYLAYFKQFRLEIFQKIKNVFRNPLLISVCAFIFIFGISAALAVNRYRAFFGDVERGEGLVGVLFFFGFFIFALLIFDKKDWLWFFKLSLIAGLILFLKALWQFLGGSNRPESYIGNPAFLAGYFLFTILSAIIVLRQHKPAKMWFWFAGLMLIFAVVGIFLTQTRGTILGLVAGFIAVAIYSAIFGKEIFIFKKLNLKTTALVLLTVLMIFSAVFYITKGNLFWQKIPGLGRIAQIGPGDASFETRRIIAGMAPEIIRPSADFQKFLIGWGPENFNIAFARHFDPSHYKWERVWFDRSHNKLIDVLIMNGILGLLAYLAVWLSFLYLIFRKLKEFSIENVGILFFGVGLFIHNLVVFDQISTYIPFFGVLAFLIFKSSLEQDNQSYDVGNRKNENTPFDGRLIFFGILMFFYLIGLFFWTLPVYFQMRTYLRAVGSGNVEILSKSFDSVSSYYTYAQENIRTHFLNLIADNYKKSPIAQDLFDKAISKMDEFLEKEPYNARHFISMAEAFRIRARIDDEPDFYQKAESYLRKAAALAPRKPDVNYILAVTLAEQGKFSEAQEILEAILELDKEIAETYYYLGLIKFSEGEKHFGESLKYLESFFNSPRIFNMPDFLADIYDNLFRYFYQTKDRQRAIVAANRLIQLKPEKKEEWENFLNNLNENR